MYEANIICDTIRLQGSALRGDALALCTQNSDFVYMPVERQSSLLTKDDTSFTRNSSFSLDSGAMTSFYATIHYFRNSLRITSYVMP